MKVTIDEIVKALRDAGCASVLDARHALANRIESLADRIEAHDIEQPSIDALIAEIDGLSPSHVNDEYGCKHSDTLIMYHACDIKAITDKYRGRK